MLAQRPRGPASVQVGVRGQGPGCGPLLCSRAPAEGLQQLTPLRPHPLEWRVTSLVRAGAPGPRGSEILSKAAFTKPSQVGGGGRPAGVTSAGTLGPQQERVGQGAGSPAQQYCCSGTFLRAPHPRGCRKAPGPAPSGLLLSGPRQGLQLPRRLLTLQTASNPRSTPAAQHWDH